MTHRRHAASRHTRTGALAAALLSAGGCGWSAAPRIEVRDVAIVEQSEEAVVLAFRLRAENRGAEPLPLRTVNYRVSAGGREVFRGTRSAEVTAPRYGSQEFTVPVALTIGPGGDLPDGPAGLVPYALSGSVEYLLPGTIAEVLFDSGLRRPRAGFNDAGRLDFQSGDAALRD
jgi:hypothetical protein